MKKKRQRNSINVINYNDQRTPETIKSSNDQRTSETIKAYNDKRKIEEIDSINLNFSSSSSSESYDFLGNPLSHTIQNHSSKKSFIKGVEISKNKKSKPHFDI